MNELALTRAGSSGGSNPSVRWSIMSKTTNKFSPEVGERAARLVLDNESQYGSRWQAVMSISAKIGCAPQTLNDWGKKT